MKQNKFWSLFAFTLILAAAAFSTTAAAQTSQTGPHDPADRLDFSVDGVWNLNIYESDDPIKKIQTLLQKSIAESGEKTSSEQSEPPRIAISILPPELLVLARNETQITVNEFFQDVISTRTFINDGQTRAIQAENNYFITVNAKTEMNKLLIETLSPRGNLMKETFRLFADGNKLSVLIQVFDAGRQEMLSLQRVYDRAAADDFLDYN